MCATTLLLVANLATEARKGLAPVAIDASNRNLAGLVYGLIGGGHSGFASPTVVITLVVAVAAIVAFVIVQARGDHPMMPLELFRSKDCRIALSVGFAIMVGNYGNVFTTSLLLRQYLGLSPLHAGLVYVPSAFFAITANLTSGSIINQFGLRLPVVTGQLLMVIGLAAPCTCSVGQR